MSRDARKTAFCMCENRGADQLRGNRKDDQRLCFHYTDNIMTLYPKYDIPSLWPFSFSEQPSLCQTGSEILKTGFLASRLKY